MPQKSNLEHRMRLGSHVVCGYCSRALPCLQHVACAWPLQERDQEEEREHCTRAELHKRVGALEMQMQALEAQGGGTHEEVTTPRSGALEERLQELEVQLQEGAAALAQQVGGTKERRKG